jgi:hypothetical protein
MSILINEHIKRVLQDDEAVSAQVDGRVYPIIIKGGTPKYPFIVYDKGSIEEESTKDGRQEDAATVSIAVVHKDYEAGIELANRVRYLFEGVRAEYEGFEVTECTFEGYAEDYLETVDAYCYTVTMIFRTFDK